MSAKSLNLEKDHASKIVSDVEKEELELVLMAQDRIASIENSQMIDFEDIVSESGMIMSELDIIKYNVELD